MWIVNKLARVIQSRSNYMGKHNIAEVYTAHVYMRRSPLAWWDTTTTVPGVLFGYLLYLYIFSATIPPRMQSPTKNEA